MHTLSRDTVPLSLYSDKALLIVNVAQSSPLATQQLAALKALKEKHKDILEIMAFPCNQFRNSPEGYQATEDYYLKEQQVNFPVMGKVDVNGPHTDYVYRFLRRHSELFRIGLMTAMPIRQDFSKFLVDKSGKVRKFYGAGQDMATIESDLAQITQ